MKRLKTNPRHTVISLDSGIRTSDRYWKDTLLRFVRILILNSRNIIPDLMNSIRYFATKKDNGSFAKDFKGKRTAISRRRKIFKN